MVLVGKPIERRPHGRLKLRWEEKLDGEHGLD
jgi:hypothetical protein